MIKQTSSGFSVDHPRLIGEIFETRRDAERAVLSDLSVIYSMMLNVEETVTRMIESEMKIQARNLGVTP